MALLLEILKGLRNIGLLVVKLKILIIQVRERIETKIIGQEKAFEI